MTANDKTLNLPIHIDNNSHNINNSNNHENNHKDYYSKSNFGSIGSICVAENSDLLVRKNFSNVSELRLDERSDLLSSKLSQSQININRDTIGPSTGHHQFLNSMMPLSDPSNQNSDKNPDSSRSQLVGSSNSSRYGPGLGLDRTHKTNLINNMSPIPIVIGTPEIQDLQDYDIIKSNTEENRPATFREQRDENVNLTTKKFDTPATPTLNNSGSKMRTENKPKTTPTMNKVINTRSMGRKNNEVSELQSPIINHNQNPVDSTTYNAYIKNNTTKIKINAGKSNKSKNNIRDPYDNRENRENILPNTLTDMTSQYQTANNHSEADFNNYYTNNLNNTNSCNISCNSNNINHLLLSISTQIKEIKDDFNMYVFKGDNTHSAEEPNVPITPNLGKLENREENNMYSDSNTFKEKEALENIYYNLKDLKQNQVTKKHSNRQNEEQGYSYHNRNQAYMSNTVTGNSNNAYGYQYEANDYLRNTYQADEEVTE
eukprot:CAMPEP_0170524104 /NCGR_PEP_ID=MMETSP0209-20121228/9514_1 /TAXON_ID=665100 ORGANISM="Litonotus pictus, Strain P1" /NCGR_SAMPLE_ID=MMETSP0209 /ASSEMBLY_ACC=CAM_ASM_000301 /LENGTH=487 /DNA_ID=CAMNT_0010812579 /DNA_START=1052 /DNA_END=2516 /DNA_ORIENTATION=+